MNQTDIGKNKEVFGLMKHELGVRIMTKFDKLRSKICSYSKDDRSGEKKPKVHLKITKIMQKQTDL